MHFCGKLTACLGLTLLLWHAEAQSQNTFKFAVNSPGSPPYLYIDKQSKQYIGLVVDVISKMTEQQKIPVRYIDSHRSRTEPLMYQGKTDGTLSSSRWLAHPEKLISTIDIVDHRSFIYSLSAFADNFKLTDLQNTRICMRRGYVYPAFLTTPGIDNIQRIDASDQLSMMHMMVKNRCNYVVMHEYNANRIISSQAFKEIKIYRSAQPHDVAKLAIFLRPELADLKKSLDFAITTMQNDGSLAASLIFHMSETQSD